MKKLYSLATVALTSLAAMATNYTGHLTVTVNGNSVEQDNVVIAIDQNDNGSYKLSLNNFILQSGSTKMGVGNIVLNNVPAAAAVHSVAGASATDSVKMLSYNDNIRITKGNQAGVPVWLGPTLGPVPIDMVARFTGDNLVTTIDIDLKSMRQVISVRFVSYTNATYNQLPNAGFEDWHKTGTSKDGQTDEPNRWHGFGSAQGAFAAAAPSQLLKSDQVRPGSSGTSSARLLAQTTFGIVANGTFTTGLLNAGYLVATDARNHSELDMSKTDVDGNGDPFYMQLTDRPDSVKVWVRFKQGKSLKEHPYATFSAAITDGTYYQDPEDKAYTNVVAKAANKTIAETGTEWKQISVPFTYTSNNVTAKALLVTMSTNADAGQGSKDDELLVDDIELVYNLHDITGISFQGAQLEGFNNATTTYTTYAQAAPSLDDVVVTADATYGSLVAKSIEETKTGWDIKVYVVSYDLKQAKLYTINVTKTTPLATVLNEGVAGTTYTLEEPLARVQAATADDKTYDIYATDGNGRWIKLTATSAINTATAGYHTFKQFSTAGAYSVENGNPALALASAPAESEENVTYEVRSFDLGNGTFNPSVNEVISITGYYDEAENTLRGYSMLKGQSATVDLKYVANGSLENGKQYTLRAAVQLKEPWEAETVAGAPRKVKASDELAFQNYIVLPFAITTPTAVDANVASKQVQQVSYTNALGITASKPFDGVNIVVTTYTDGTTSTVKALYRNK